VAVRPRRPAQSPQYNGAGWRHASAYLGAVSGSCRRADAAEQAALRFLESTCLGTIVQEPDGNVPPDFVIDGRVAVEVRRLNVNEIGPGRLRSLDQTARPFLDRFRTLLASYGRATDAAWWVGIEFRRPLPPWESLGPAARGLLDEFNTDPTSRGERRALHRGVRVDLLPRPVPARRRFKLAWARDGDAQGARIPLMERNVECCIRDKTAKVRPYRARYPEWWLVLVDVAFGLDPQEQCVLRQRGGMGHDWDRVFVLNPAVPALSFDL